MPALDENYLNIYTDGSCKDNPRRGGYAYRYILVDDITGLEEYIDCQSGCCKGANNNQMELMACIDAIKTALKDRTISEYLQTKKKVVIYTDSLYIQGNYKYALYNWSANDWTKAEGASVENIKLWKELNLLTRRVYRDTGKRIAFEKVKAHQRGAAKDPHNDAVDKLAKQSRDSKTTCKCDLIPPEDVRRKNTTEKTVPGSIILTGQTMSIYVIRDKRIRKGHFGIKYKVIDTENEYFNVVDSANSDIPLRAGHYYKATFNDKQKNPLILSVEEIDKPDNA